MGESRLFERDGAWSLHLTVIRNAEDQTAASAAELTPIGVDIGEASLVTVCYRDNSGPPVRPRLWADDGRAVRRLRKTHFTAKRRLQKRDSERIAESYGDTLWDRIDDVFHRVTREVVEYAESAENLVWCWET